jgi:hypothetical protein
LIGAIVVVILTRLDQATVINMIAAGGVVLVVRLTALYRRWSAPIPP